MCDTFPVLWEAGFSQDYLFLKNQGFTNFQFYKITLNIIFSIMNQSLVLAPTLYKGSDFAEAQYAEVIGEVKPARSYVSFLDANTNAVTMEELKNQCVVPTWANQELTIAHQDFISCVHDAAKVFYQGETVNAPDIRVSHIVRGRTPNALGKKASELLECEKTQFYQRLAFAFTVPTIFETLEGQKMELCVGGVRNYSDLNLYRTSKGMEKFSVFVGWRVNICSNQILTGQGVKLSMEVMNIADLYKNVMDLFSQFNPAKDFHLMHQLSDTFISESQFAQIVGRMRMYQALPQGYARRIPRLLITDSQVNAICRGFYHNETFGMKDNAISLYSFHNLVTESNKNNYIDSYLQRGLNASEVCVGLNNALCGTDDSYKWFLG